MFKRQEGGFVSLDLYCGRYGRRKTFGPRKGAKPLEGHLGEKKILEGENDPLFSVHKTAVEEAISVDTVGIIDYIPARKSSWPKTEDLHYRLMEY